MQRRQLDTTQRILGWADGILQGWETGVIMYDASEITTKVKKLLALAARAGTEAEAVTAADR